MVLFSQFSFDLVLYYCSYHLEVLFLTYSLFIFNCKLTVYTLTCEDFPPEFVYQATCEFNYSFSFSAVFDKMKNKYVSYRPFVICKMLQ